MGLGSTNTQRRTTTTKRWTLFALIVVKQSMRSVIARSLEIKLKLTRAWLSTVRRRTVAATSQQRLWRQRQWGIRLWWQRQWWWWISSEEFLQTEGGRECSCSDWQNQLQGWHQEGEGEDQEARQSNTYIRFGSTWRTLQQYGHLINWPKSSQHGQVDGRSLPGKSLGCNHNTGVHCTLFLLNPVLKILLLLLLDLIDANYSKQSIPTNHLLMAMAFVFSNLLLWQKTMQALWSFPQHSNSKRRQSPPTSATFWSPTLLEDHQKRQLDTLREKIRRLLVAQINVEKHTAKTKVPNQQRLITTSVYFPPVRHKRLPYHLKKQCYNRFQLRPPHRPKRSKSTIDWKTQAKVSHYTRRTPVWPFKTRTYCWQCY